MKLNILKRLLNFISITLVSVFIIKADLSKLNKNAVLQIYANIGKFDFLHPYRNPKIGQGSGSAFLIDENGYIITNFHVVNDSKSLFAYMPAIGRQPLEVNVVGVCPEADVALLKLTEESIKLVKEIAGTIPFLELGDSDKLEPSEWVMAAGYPLGERYLKMTVGVFAGREYTRGQSLMHITAPINPGNSGGPLFNKEGKVVGINTSGIPYMQSEGKMLPVQGMGFIVPINDVKILLESLHKIKLVRKPFFGVDFNNATEEHTKSLKNPWPGGVYINYVAEKSIADILGLKVGDMLYEINGFKVDAYGDVNVGWRSSSKVSFYELLNRFAIGQELKLVIYRDGKTFEFCGKYESSTVYPVRYIYPDLEEDAAQYEIFAGLCIMQLRENHIQLLSKVLSSYSKIEFQSKNILLVTSIFPGSMADRVKCFNVGTVLSKVNNMNVATLQELKEALLKSAQTGVIALETDEKYATVLSLEKVLNDEVRLVNNFRYPVSETIKKLWQLTYGEKCVS